MMDIDRLMCDVLIVVHLVTFLRVVTIVRQRTSTGAFVNAWILTVSFSRNRLPSTEVQPESVHVPLGRAPLRSLISNLTFKNPVIPESATSSSTALSVSCSMCNISFSDFLECCTSGRFPC